MRCRKRALAAAVALGAAGALSAAGALAQGLDGSRNMACAVVSVVACGDAHVCYHGLAKQFGLPEIMVVDMSAKKVRGTAESGDKQDSPIRHSESTGSQFVLQGVENGHGWSMAIDRKSGRMATVLSGELVSYMIFGTCTAD
jgi:hypothetical protein